MRRLFIKTIIISIILCNNLHAQWDYSHPIPGTASFNNHSNLFPNNDLDITNRNGIPVRESNLINWGEYNNLSSNGDDIVGFTWAQTRKGAMNVFVQLCDLDGNTLLIENGLQLTNDQWAQRESCIKYAGNNQWIVGWYDYRREAPCGNPLDTLNRLHNKPYFYLQKIDRYGNLLWGLNGVSLWNDSRENYVTDLVSDNNGGCIVVWEDRANYSYSGQHLGADGALLWMRDGFQLTENSSDISKILVYDNELYYSWTAIESRIKNIYVQKMNFEGQKLWGDNGVYLSEGYERNWYPQIIEDADGGIFVSWIREGLVFRGPLFVDIYLQHLDSNGSILFNEGGICLEQGGGPIGHYNFNFVNTRVNEFVYSFRREDLTDWTNKIYYQKCQVLDGEIVLGWNNSESDPKLAKELSSLMYNKELYLCNETSVILVIENEIYKIGFDGILSWNQPLFIENLSSSFSITLLDDNICAIESY
ncbi:MAG: hypothetical protein RAP03_07485, partial [Candidatus Electryonea clarkiae]|nr:hypothetical protein [Candidatus Electryonea clarkiae]